MNAFSAYSPLCPTPLSDFECTSFYDTAYSFWPGAWQYSNFILMEYPKLNSSGPTENSILQGRG